MSGNVNVKATPPGIAVSLGSTKLGVESGLSNPRPGGKKGSGFNCYIFSKRFRTFEPQLSRHTVPAPLPRL